VAARNLGESSYNVAVLDQESRNRKALEAIEAITSAARAWPRLYETTRSLIDVAEATTRWPTSTPHGKDCGTR